MGFEEIICKLCLEKCDTFKTIDANTKNVLDILLLKIDFTVIQEPVMCKNCAEMLIKCSDFKALQFANKKEDAKLDLKNISLNLNKDVTGTGVLDNQDVCVFCMGLANTCSTLSVNVKEGDVMLKKMIEQCLPEIDLRIFKKFVVCASCHGSLENCFRFVTSCLIVEEKVKEFCETIDINNIGQIELSKLLQFIKRDVKTGVVDGNSVKIIKAEDQRFCVDRKSADGIETDNGGRIIKLEPPIFNPSESAYEDFEIKKESFSEVDDQKVNNEHHVIPNNMLAGEGGSNKLGSIKEEVFCEGGIKLKEENLVGMKDQTFLFDREIEIKTDDHDFSRFT